MTTLILSPHTDDAEFGMGATIAKFRQQGHPVHIAAFSACMQSVREDLPADVLLTEFHAAAEVLGIPREHRHLRDFQVRTFDRHRQEILDWMIQLRQRIRPDRVYMPSLADTHQDHHIVATEALRAFKHCTLLSYELPWNCPHFHAQCFEDVGVAECERKMDAIACYTSQRHRRYARAAFTLAQIEFRGAQCDARSAEAFEVVRIIHPSSPTPPSSRAAGGEAGNQQRGDPVSRESGERDDADPTSPLLRTGNERSLRDGPPASTASTLSTNDPAAEYTQQPTH